MAASKIRIKSEDVRQLERSVRNFNAKISRELKKDESLREYLPQRKSLREEKKALQEMSRREFQYNLKAMVKFRKGGTPEKIETITGIRTTKYQVDLLKNMQRRENISIAIKSKANKNNYLKGISSASDKWELEQKKIDIKTMTPDDLKEKEKALTKRLSSQYQRRRLEQFKTNYLQGMKQAGEVYSKELYDRIENMPAKKLLNLSKNYPEMEIDYHYPTSISDDEDYEARILEILKMDGEKEKALKKKKV